MKKKVLAVLMVAVLVSGAAFASILQIGPAVQYGMPVGDIRPDKNALTTLGNYQFGADMRVNVALFNLNAMALYGFDAGTSTHVFDTTLTAGIRIGLPFVEVGAGVGPSLTFATGDFRDFNVNGYPVSDFLNVLKNSSLAYRFNVTVPVGPVSIGAVYTVGTELTFADFDFKHILPDFSKGRISVSCLFNLL